MFSIKGTKYYNSLRFKLTVWFSLIFTAVFLLVFLIVQIYVRNHLAKLTDTSLSEKVKIHLWLGYPGGDSPVDLKDIRETFEFKSTKEGISNVFYFYFDSVYGRTAESSLEYWEGLNFDSMYIPYLPDQPNKETIKSFLGSKRNKALKTDLATLDHEYRSYMILQTIKIPGRNDKIRVAYQYFNNHRLFITGISLQNNKDFIAILNRLLLISYLIILMVVIFLVNILTKKSLEGVEKVKETAISIGKNKLNFRVPYKNETTEIQSLANAFNNMLDRIEQLMKEQKAITHNIAHDLRSPITSIRGIAETTLSSKATKIEYEQMTGKIISNCDRLVHMINSMLDISDIEVGNFKSITQELSIQQILDNCFEIYQPLAEEKQITFLKQDIDHTVHMNGSRELLQRAFGNLVGNAIKYTGNKGTVSLNAEKNHTSVIVKISDNGIGIPREEQQRIFERFYRVDKSRSIEGNGLGLSLAKAYLEYQDGHIEVESEIGKGSTFIITLPSC